VRPPRLAERLLRAATPAEDREFLLADIAEEFQRLTASAGRGAAVRWYWRQTLASLTPLVGGRATRRFRQVRSLRLSSSGIAADLMQAARFVRRHPGMSFAVVSTLTIAFAATLAAYAIIDAVLLAPLPFPSADRIVTVRATGPTLSRGVRSSSRPDVEDWRERSRTFTTLSAYTPEQYRLTNRGEPRSVDAVRVMAELDRVFGLKPLVGRVFEPADFTNGSAPVAILTYGFWVGEFGKSPEAIGQTLRLDNRDYEIVGILPDAGMHVPPGPHQMWVPLIPREEAFWEHSRGTGWLFAVGRLRDGVTIEQADADLTVVARQLAAQYPDSNRPKTEAELTPLRTELVGPVAPMLQLLGAALATVLIIGCANIGSLLAASAAARTREFAVRSAIGAGGLQLARQITGETLLLCGVSATAAAAISPLFVRAFLSLYPNPLPRAVQDQGILAAAVPATILALAVSCLLALPQMLQVRRISIRAEMSGMSRATASRGQRIGRAALVGLQVALSFVLITAGVSFIRTVRALSDVDNGYQPDGVLVFTVAPPPTQTSADGSLNFYAGIVQALREIPGVRAAASAVGVPMTSAGWRFGIRPAGASSDVLVSVNLTSPGYFDALGIHLLEGRLLTPEEQRRGAGVAVVNEPLARVLGGQVIGRKFPYSNTTWEIVGVIDGVRSVRPRDEPMPELIIPWHMAGRRPQAIVLRAQVDPISLLPEIRARVQRVDPTAPLNDVARLDDRLREAAGLDRFRAAMLAALAGIAVILAGLGAYSITAFSVARRTREYGIRIALGERPRSVGRRALAAAGVPAAAGIVTGAAASLAGAWWIQSFLYGVSASAPSTLIGTAVLLFIIAMAAAVPSARRAAAIDPVLALGAE
jgi:putative ABC transport system permease protein